MRAFVRLVFLLALDLITMNVLGHAATKPAINSPAIPLTFEQNDGQVEKQYSFVARHGSIEALFSDQGMDLFVPQADAKVSMVKLRQSSGIRSSGIHGERPLKGEANYLRGSNPAAWITSVPTYGQLRYAAVCPGVDLVFHSNETGKELEHDYVVAPGADPNQIGFTLAGTDSLTLLPNGALRIKVGARSLLFRRPAAYQETAAGERQPVEASFHKDAAGVVRFRVAPYDHRRPLTIDPVLSFATYFDGSGADHVNALAVDASGNVYLAGSTSSTDFPTANAEQTVHQGSGDAFIAKLDPTGRTLVYSTYLGGTNTDEAESIAVDANGNVAVSGTSVSRDFPQAGKLSSSNPNYTVTYNFISSLNASGSALRYSGFLGSTAATYDDDNPRLNRVTFDTEGYAYIAGLTGDTTFPITPGAYGGAIAPYPADETLFVAKVAEDGGLVYAATIPETPKQQTGSQNLRIDLGNLKVDATGSVAVGGTAANDLPTTSGTLSSTFPASNVVPRAGFVLRLNTSGSALQFSTYLPGTNRVTDLALDAMGNSYTVGITLESNLATSANAFQKSLILRGTDGESTYAGDLVKLSSDGARSLAATYFGGTTPQAPGFTFVSGLALDNNGNVDFAGSTGASDLPLKNPLTSTESDLGSFYEDDDLFVAQLSSDLSTLQFGSFLNASDQASQYSAIAVSPNGRILVAGTTLSNTFPTTTGSFQPSSPAEPSSQEELNWNFIAAIDLSVPAPSMCFNAPGFNFADVLVNTSATSTVNVTNCGNAALTVSKVTSSDPTVTANDNCSGIAPATTCQLQATYKPTGPGSVQGSLTLSANTAIAPQLFGFTGSAGYPLVSLPTSLPFSDLLVGQTGATNSVFAFNNGTGAFILSSATITGDFQIMGNSCTSALPVNRYCVIDINFSPTAAGPRTGTLTLTDNLSPTVQTITLTGNGLTTAPVPAITVIPAIPVSQGQTTIHIWGSGFLPNSTVLWNGSPRTTLYATETEVFATLPATDVQQVGEAQVTVTTPAPGGGTSAPTVATIYGGLPNLQTMNEVFDPHSQFIYATVSKNSHTNPNSVVVIDPVKMQVVKTLLSGNGPNAIAVSDDGALLYVGLDDILSVTQIALPSGTQNFTVPLPAVSAEFPEIVAAGLHTLPGHPHTWLAGLCEATGEPCGAGVAVFDDAVIRPLENNDSQLTANSFVFVNDPTVVYSTEYDLSPSAISVFKISPYGIQKTATSLFLPAVGGSPLSSDGSSIYDGSGRVINPAALAITSSYPQVFAYPSAAYTLDTANQRLFFAQSSDPADPLSLLGGMVLTTVSQKQRNTIGEIVFPDSGAANVERFGVNGVAINQGTQWLFLKTSLVQNTAPAISATAAPAALQFGSRAAGTPSAPQQVSVTNTGQTAIAINTSISGDYAASGCQGLLLPSASCSISVIFTPTIAGDRTGVLTILDFAPGKPLTVALDGSGTGPIQSASASPSALSFGNVTQGATSPSQTVTLTNTGTVPLTVGTPNATEAYAATTNCGPSLAVAASCTITVTFTPLGPGDQPGQLTIEDSSFAGNQVVSLDGAGTAGYQFIPVAPCRVVDTRGPDGPFAGPELTARSSREFEIPKSNCGIPASAVAYSLNVTVVPDASLGYLTLWPSGAAQPLVSTLNSDGRVKANAAITPAGSNGGVSVYVSDASHLILDINGYFVPAGTASALAFYPVTPCRIADTRTAAGSLGGPFLTGGSTRSFPVQSSNCGLPAYAQAYSLNVTAVPHTILDYLTLWPTGLARPNVSTLNSVKGTVLANAAVVPAGTDGAVSLFVTNDADVILDVSGYFAPPLNGGLSFYTNPPCRVLDTRPAAISQLAIFGFGPTPCGSTIPAHTYVMNATVVPVGTLNYLTLWDGVSSQPAVSMLNALDGAVTSNMAIVTTSFDDLGAFSAGTTNLILDVSGSFAP